MFVYQCKDSLESIFTAIYNVYEYKRNVDEVRLSLSDELMLFASYVAVREDMDKVRKVIRSLHRYFGEEDYLHLCYALASPSPDKAQAVFGTIAAGLDVLRGKTVDAPHKMRLDSSQGTKRGKGHLFDNLANDAIHLAFTLGKAAANEHHHLLGFLRFQELENKILFARIGPKNNILTFLMPHFADRLPGENFVIYDDQRNFFGVHPAGGTWYLVEGSESDGMEVDRGYGTGYGEDGAGEICGTGVKEGASETDGTEEGIWNRKDRIVDVRDRIGYRKIDRLESRWSEAERGYQELFRAFCHRIAIKERKNLKCQRNMLPLRFQEYMIEFQNYSQKSNLGK